jgi:regulator of protease activity HflC (stomatin/prohibitin superfamily)
MRLHQRVGRLNQRDALNARIQEVVDAQTEPWGIKVMLVELKNIDLPQEMQRAIAAQAEAERERRAKVIAAEGEFQAAQRLAEAASRRSLRPACAGTC